MKKFAVYIAVFIYLAGVSQSAVSGFAFLLNRDFIAKNYCVNQDKPEMKCNGLCYLKDRIRQQENPEEKAPVPAPEPRENPVNLIPESHSWSFLETNDRQWSLTDACIPESSFPDNVWHPPRLIV